MGRSTLLWLLLPPEALVLVLIGGAFLVMFRLVSVRAVLGAVVFLALLPVFAPIIEAVFSLLPAWLSLVLLAAIGIWFLQAVATFILGRGAAEHMAGTLAADLVRIVVLATLFPFRLLWRFFWR
jgi:hypothetical protein